MIQANELRVGNLIDYLGKIITVDANTIFAVSRIVYPSVIYRPIPLSPEILEKCGIKDIWIKNSWKVIEDISCGESFGWAMKVRNASYTKEIEFAYFKYLHQLQNLYFALTGEELPYTP